MELVRRPIPLVFAPNALSALRLALAGTFWMMPIPWRIHLVIIGGLSDLADGYIARKFKLETWQGAILDAVADKLFTLSVLLTLTFAGPLSVFQLFILLARDLTIGAIVLYICVRRDWWIFKQMPPRVLGKLTTLGQYLVMVTALLMVDQLWVAFAFAGSLSVLAAADYFVVSAVAKIDHDRASQSGE